MSTELLMPAMLLRVPLEPRHPRKLVQDFDSQMATAGTLLEVMFRAVGPLVPGVLLHVVDAVVFEVFLPVVVVAVVACLLCLMSLSSHQRLYLLVIWMLKLLEPK